MRGGIPPTGERLHGPCLNWNGLMLTEVFTFSSSMYLSSMTAVLSFFLQFSVKLCVSAPAAEQMVLLFVFLTVLRCKNDA